MAKPDHSNLIVTGIFPCMGSCGRAHRASVSVGFRATPGAYTSHLSPSTQLEREMVRQLSSNRDWNVEGNGWGSPEGGVHVATIVSTLSNEAATVQLMNMTAAVIAQLEIRSLWGANNPNDLRRIQSNMRADVAAALVYSGRKTEDEIPSPPENGGLGISRSSPDWTMFKIVLERAGAQRAGTRRASQLDAGIQIQP